MRKLALAAASIGTVLFAAGCGTATTASGATGASETAAPSLAAPSAVATTPSARATAGCPVTVETLTDALKASSDRRFNALPGHVSLSNVQCLENFAAVRADPTGGQRSQLLFGFDPATGVWRPLNEGSADYCRGYVPDAIASHFSGCG
jgi:hypothetical protein